MGEVFTLQKLANSTNQGSLYLCRASFQYLPAFLWSESLFVQLSIISLIVPGTEYVLSKCLLAELMMKV